MSKRTIEVEDAAKLSFKFRADADVLKENAVDVLVNADLSKLSAEDILEWAFSAMVVSYQSKLRSKTPPVKNDKGEYDWAVPSRGTRSTQDPAKVEKQMEGLVGKLDLFGKYQLFIKMGMPENLALSTCLAQDPNFKVPVAVATSAPVKEEPKK